jgi:hypothetical protein
MIIPYTSVRASLEIQGLSRPATMKYKVTHFVSIFRYVLWAGMFLLLKAVILLQKRPDLLGCTDRGRWLYSPSTIRRFCYESSAGWLLWNIAVQDFCVHWWTYFCGRGEVLLKFIIMSFVSTHQQWRSQIWFLEISFYDSDFFLWGFSIFHGLICQNE